jgi:CHAT domain-containing protein/Tfp pilus assembly protein PilF
MLPVRLPRVLLTLFCCVFVTIVIVVISLPDTASIAAETAATSEAPIQLSPGSDIHRELAAGTKDTFVLSLDQGKLLRFSITKGDLVLSTTLYGPTGTKLVEDVSHDFELVQISFSTQVAGTYRIELQSIEKASTRGPYELKVQQITNSTTLDQKGSEAWQAFARADRLRSDWTENGFRQAAAQYDRAAQIWKSISDFANASHATLKSAHVYFRLSEYPNALKRYQNALTLAERAGDWLVKARALSQSALVQTYLGKNGLADKQVTESLHLFNEHEANQNLFANNAYGEALCTLAQVNYEKGDFLKSTRQLDEALKVFANDRKGEARVRLFKGYIAGGLGDLETALAEITRARELYTEINNRIGVGLTLTALGLWHSSQNAETALGLHKEALEIFRSIGAGHSEAVALNAIGQAYEGLSEHSLSLTYYDQALRRFQDIGALDGVSVSLFKIARVHDLAERFEQALSYYERSVQVSRAAGKVRTEGFALNEIATIYVKQGLYEQAEAQYRRVLKFFESIGDLRGQATALNSYGDFLLQRGQKQRALELYSRALPLSEKVGDEDIRTAALYNLARANLALGAAESALSFIQQSMRNIEELRSSVRSPEFRATYFSGAQKHSKLCIEILMQLDKRRPGEGFATQAFIVSEKNRSRVLLDLVNESRVNIREGAAKELLDRERKLRGLIQLQAQYRMGLVLSGKNSSELADVENQLAQLKADYQVVEGQLRQHNPRLLSLEQSTALSLEQVQRELRDGDTMLLEYSLGDERSYLWAVTSNSFQTYELPSRKTIEDHARECYTLLTTRQGTVNEEYPAKLVAADSLGFEERSKLGDMLLSPLAGQLENRRLLVVSEGALQYVPFDALLVPRTAGEKATTTLLETNEVVVLPSVATLIAMRSTRNHSTSTNKLVAVIADPVFSAIDDRVRRGVNDPTVAQAAIEKNTVQPLPKTPAILMRDGSLQRLLHASEEADAISNIAPWGSTMIAKGFEASRETAMSSAVGQYQIVHFATHGFLNSEQPELSGIVLTMVDQNGVNTNGLMPLHDIYNLKLSSELTVLSACQTALGKEIRGEGIVGLTHGFMAAGSKSVVASLWKVDDRATAALMADFYEAMLEKGMPPAAALRSAKLKMMREKNWSAPYYWAGFQLQGEYANPIAVNHLSWIRPMVVLLFLLILIVAGLLVFQKRKQRFPLSPSN